MVFFRVSVMLMTLLLAVRRAVRPGATCRAAPGTGVNHPRAPVLSMRGVTRTTLSSTRWLTTRRRSASLVINQSVEEEFMDQLSQAFAALADPTRRDLVARLAVG